MEQQNQSGEISPAYSRDSEEITEFIAYKPIKILSTVNRMAE